MADMQDILNSFLGGGMHSAAGRGGRRARDETRSLSVTLEDLYTGKSVELPHRKNVVCNACQGSGSRVKRPRGYPCTSCRGSGRRVVVQQMGMMIQQMQVTCDACGGSGESIPDNEKCTACRGKKVTEVNTPIKVEVQKGMAHGQEIRLQGEGGVEPNSGVTSDVVVVLQQTKHDLFVRQNCDLHMGFNLTLAEALCGFQAKVNHLSGRSLVLRKNRGEITKPGDVQCVKGEGMPLYPGNGKYGDLIIEFSVTFPPTLDPALVEVLRGALPGEGGSKVQHDGEIHYVGREDVRVLQQEIEKAEEDEDSDEGTTAGCQAQ